MDTTPHLTDADAAPHVRAALGIGSIPTVMVLRDSAPVEAVDRLAAPTESDPA